VPQVAVWQISSPIKSIKMLPNLWVPDDGHRAQNLEVTLSHVRHLRRREQSNAGKSHQWFMNYASYPEVGGFDHFLVVHFSVFPCSDLERSISDINQHSVERLLPAPREGVNLHA